MTATVAELWLPIPDYEALYQVSDWGNVLGVKRGRFLKRVIDKHGYRIVSLSKDNKRKCLRVHALVALAFLGPRPKHLVCCHKNGNPLDCSLGNLEYKTQAENIMDKHRHGTMSKGGKHYLAKLTDAEREEARRLYQFETTPITELAATYGVSYQTMWKIVQA